MVGKWVRRGCEGAWGGKLADRLLRAAEDHIAAHCWYGLNPPQEWLAMLSDPKKDDVGHLTRVELSDDAQLAVRSTAEFVLQAATAELFINVCFSLAAREYKYDPAFLLCAYVGDALFGPESPTCLEDLYRANTTLLPEMWMEPVTIEELADRVKRTVRPDLGLVDGRGPDWKEVLEAALIDPKDDRLAIAAFPPRSPQDLGIRYVQASDVWAYYLKFRGEDELRRTLR